MAVASRRTAAVGPPLPDRSSAVSRPSSPPADVPEHLSGRVVIERVRPTVDGGRFPIKRTPGEPVDVRADIFADGHDVIVAVLCDTGNPKSQIPNPKSQEWRETPMRLIAPGADEWTASFQAGQPGWHDYHIVAWVDRFQSWRRAVQIKATAGQDLGVELQQGAMLVREAAARAEQIGSGADDSRHLVAFAETLAGESASTHRIDVALCTELSEVMAKYADRSRATRSAVYRAWIDRERARFGAWYEMFPRSAGPEATRSGTFAEAATLLPRIADMGFDVLYLPPIHPIGTTFRKGANNSLLAGPDDPGSPWAIGSHAGGHTAVEPGLGTLEDFDNFRTEAERLGLEIALDLAWQCSPDHPWVREHPEWFRRRPDGSVRYAENPPKKYQDIYPFDFESGSWKALWHELYVVTRFWIDRGVRIFRVDNPHTKTFGFWEWLIDRVHAEAPDVVFLSEAFTRPTIMRYLAKAGFSQSYTYFTWRNSRQELTDYFTELTTGDSAEYLRPNLFANTPDILHAYLQHGGRPAFEARLLLAATLGASYGIYSGFELCEARAASPGSEEYADSEKYSYRKRNWSTPNNLGELVARVNDIRRRHPALQYDRSLRFHDSDNNEIIAYSKQSPDAGDHVLTIVNLDPHHTQHGFVDIPVDADLYPVCDLLDGTTYTWHRGWNYVRFDPGVRQGHVLLLPRGGHS